MKKMIQKLKKGGIALALTLGLFSAVRADAQIFYSFTQVTGTNYQPVLTSFQVTSNLVTLAMAQHTLIVTNINTNEAITVSYLAPVLGTSPTNSPALSTFTTNFPASAGWTNGATWIYNVPSGYYTPAVTPYAFMAISNGATGGSCTNGVLFQ